MIREISYRLFWMSGALRNPHHFTTYCERYKEIRYFTSQQGEIYWTTTRQQQDEGQP